MRVSRRRLIQMGSAIASALPVMAQSPTRDATDAGLAPFKPNRNQRFLFKGGTIISMDPAVGDFVQGDILVQGKKITAVGTNVKWSGPAPRVIDAANTILLPGFVDCHRHSWEGVLRRIIPNGDIAKYTATTHQGFAPFYRPRDMYMGNLITALGCIDAGITCIIDNSHNSRSAMHSDAAVRALFDSGIRAVHASGAPQREVWDHQWPQDLERLQKRFFSSDDQLVTLRMFSGLDRENYRFARKLGLRITTELQGAPAAATLEQFFNEKLLGPDVTYNHCGGLTDRAWQSIRESGGTVDVCPRSDPQYGLGDGLPAFQTALDHGIRPGLSVDNEVSYGTDMFTEMRVAFNIQRAVATNRKAHGDGNPPKPVNVRDMLECATVNGAACAGLSAKCGTLTPGKEADIVMIRTDDINLYPSNNAVGTVVAAADIKNIDTVMIAGMIRKSGGKILGVNWPKLRTQIDESRNYLFEKAGFKLDIFSA